MNVAARCSAGNYMTKTGCRQCGENSYSGDGASSCISCPDGKTSVTGSTSVEDCQYGMCLLCQKEIWILCYVYYSQSENYLDLLFFYQVG